jgi:hypothetical protein
VAAERRRRGIEAFEPKRGPFDWTAERIAALGTDTDVNVAARLEACVSTVVRKRLILGIPAFHPRQYHGPQGHLWSPQELALLGTMSDADVGKEVGLSSSAVNMKRLSLGIPAFKPAAPRVDWSEGKLALLGAAPDMEVARRLLISEVTVKRHRLRRGIAASGERRPVAPTRELVALLHLQTSEVQRRTGLKDDTIRALRERLGIPAPRAAGWRWTAAALARLGREPDARIAGDLGLTKERVAEKRRQLGIPPQRRWRRWTAEETALLGTAPDPVVARRIGRATGQVSAKRGSLGIPRVGPALRRRWRRQEIALLGTASDAEVAERLGRPMNSVRLKRRSLRIPPCPTEQYRLWRPEEIRLLGTAPDPEIAERLDRSQQAIRGKRRKLGIPGFRPGEE